MDLTDHPACPFALNQIFAENDLYRSTKWERVHHLSAAVWNWIGRSLASEKIPTEDDVAYHLLMTEVCVHAGSHQCLSCSRRLVEKRKRSFANDAYLFVDLCPLILHSRDDEGGSDMKRVQDVDTDR